MWLFICLAIGFIIGYLLSPKRSTIVNPENIATALNGARQLFSMVEPHLNSFIQGNSDSKIEFIKSGGLIRKAIFTVVMNQQRVKLTFRVACVDPSLHLEYYSVIHNEETGAITFQPIGISSFILNNEQPFQCIICPPMWMGEYGSEALMLKITDREGHVYESAPVHYLDTPSMIETLLHPSD